MHTTKPGPMRMTCSCRSAALQIFVRSLAQVYAPTTQHVGLAWPATKTRFASPNIPFIFNCRRVYTTTGSSDAVAEDSGGQPALSEHQQKPQFEWELPISSLQSRPADPPTEDDRLFSITLISKSVRRKPRRYSKQASGDQKPEERKPEERKPEERKPEERKPEERKPEERKPEERKPEERKPEERKPEERKPEVLKSKDGAWRKPGQTSRANTERKSWDRGNTGRRAKAARIDRQPANAKDREARKDDKPLWLKQKLALKEKFPEGWRPPKRLSPDALEGIRVLNRQFPDMYTTEALADKFEVSPEAIRRILRAKWEPSAEEEEGRHKRWFKRGISVWQRYAELGRRPPRRWLEAGVEVGPRDGVIDKEENVAEEADTEKERQLQSRSGLPKNLV